MVGPPRPAASSPRSPLAGAGAATSDGNAAATELFPVRVTGAEVRRRGKRLVGPVDLCLGSHGIGVVIGPNGAGKTSLLKMLHGLERLAAGRIDWPCGHAAAQARQAFVFQTPVMLRRSVRDNIAYPLRLTGHRRAAARTAADGWVARIGLSEATERPASVLSGGERQKLALARALVTGPALLFLDEPCASLDGRAMREIEALLHAAAAAGTRILMSTHDMGQARRLADEVLFIHRGQVHEFAAAAAFFDAPGTPEARAFLDGDIVEQ